MKLLINAFYIVTSSLQVIGDLSTNTSAGDKALLYGMGSAGVGFILLGLYLLKHLLK